MSDRLCGVKRCRRLATEAFDVGSGWSDWRSNPSRVHYEVCARHAAEFWPAFDGPGTYLTREQGERIRARIVATP